jgi:hypothetical protein
MEDSKNLFCSSNILWTREKNFFEIYSQFGHAPSNRFASPVLGGLYVVYKKTTKK